MHNPARSAVMGIALFPLLFGIANAAQGAAVEPPGAPWVFSSEDSGTGAYLGVDVNDITTERLSALKLKEEKGVEVTMVDQDAPAGKAGIQEHDVILAMNGTPVESGAQLRRMIRETPPGRIVSLDLSRDGQPVSVKVQLGDKHREFTMVSPKMKDFHIEIPPIPNMKDMEIPEINVMVVRSSARSGLMVENLTAQLGEFFGVKGAGGVLVRSVEKGSRAEKAGLKAGDVIVKVNSDLVHDTGDFTRAMHGWGGGSATISVVRDKKEQKLNLILPEQKDGGDGSGEMEDESFDAPDLAAKSYELTELNRELAQLEPQLSLASEQLRDAERRLQRTNCDMQRKQLREQVQQLRLKIKPEVQDELVREKKKLQDEMLKMSRRMQGGLDI